jgi:hypothetical protein
MAVRWAITGGTWSSTSTWNNGATLGIPTVGDDVYTNGFIVTVNTGFTVNSLNNSARARTIATPQMSANNAPSPYVAAASGVVDSTQPFQAFDRNTTTTLWATLGPSGWLSMDFGSSIIIDAYTIFGDDQIQNPRNWTFEGSNNNVSWDILQTVTLPSAIATNSTYSSGNIGNVTAYRYYRINVTLNGGGTRLRMRELELYQPFTAALAAGGNFNFNTSGVTANTTSINAISNTSIINVSHSSGSVQLTSTNTPSLAVTINQGVTYMTHSGNGDFTITAPNLNCPTAGGGDQGSKILLNKTGAGRLTVNGNLIYNHSNFSFDSGRVITSTLGDIVINGNLSYLGTGGNAVASHVVNQSNGNLTINGNINAPTGFAANLSSTVRFAGSLLTINGNLLPNVGLTVNTSSPMILNGSVTGNSSTVAIISTSSMTVIGNVVALNAAAISNTSSALISITGDVTASAVANAVSSSGQVYLNGNMFNVNGKMAIYAPIIWLDQTGTTQARFFTSGGADRTLYSDNTFPNQPSTSDVRNLTKFGPSSGLTGTLIMASPTNVRSGVNTDNTVGTALFDTSQLLAELNASSDPIAQRLRKVATPEILGQLLAAYKK